MSNQNFIKNFFLFLSIFSMNKSYSQACLPNDPLAINPGNLCLEEKIYHQYINNYPMTNGYASDGFYGSAISPIIPGQKIEINQNSDGYFTNLTNNNGNIKIETSTGKVFNFNSN
tara:strand:+ start:92 stop:436 length:345 start_codon:yes stop_codon:yes gene_type:complete